METNFDRASLSRISILEIGTECLKKNWNTFTIVLLLRRFDFTILTGEFFN